MSKIKSNAGDDAVVDGTAAAQPQQAQAGNAPATAAGYEGRGGLYQDSGDGTLVLLHRTAAATENSGEQSV